MPLKIGEYLPDYLKDFEDVNVLCDALETYCLRFYLEIGHILDDIRLVSADSARWNKMVFCQSGFTQDGKRISVLHKIVPKPTLEDYSFYVTHWLDNDVTVNLSFDKEANTFYLRLVGENDYTDEKARCLRNLFPMNSRLVVEVEE